MPWKGDESIKGIERIGLHLLFTCGLDKSSTTCFSGPEALVSSIFYTISGMNKSFTFRLLTMRFDQEKMGRHEVKRLKVCV